MAEMLAPVLEHFKYEFPFYLNCYVRIIEGLVFLNYIYFSFLENVIT